MEAITQPLELSLQRRHHNCQNPFHEDPKKCSPSRETGVHLPVKWVFILA